RFDLAENTRAATADSAERPREAPDPVVVLRQEVRMAGEAATMLRVSVCMIIAFPTLAVAGLGALGGLHGSALEAALVPLTLTAAAVGALESAVALLYRTCRRAGFCRQLAQRSAAERAAILLPLRSDRWSDT